MTFTVMHGIDPASPLWNATPSSLAAQQVEIVVTVTGLDETMLQAVHARTSYLAHEVLWDHRFADVFTKPRMAVWPSTTAASTTPNRSSRRHRTHPVDSTEFNRTGSGDGVLASITTASVSSRPVVAPSSLPSVPPSPTLRRPRHLPCERSRPSARASGSSPAERLFHGSARSSKVERTLGICGRGRG